ncbi:hypothetical protein AX15_002524 [Amanita polypyramis BW_CC]|nr:hypothetical protein AX15_002524 [Amanita polypyramis BW_CC]
MPRRTYDPSSIEEQPVPLPSTPLIRLNRNTVVQPPLTRRGTGPGLIIFLPSPLHLEFSTKPKLLDPEPVQKWAEEGFAVAGVTLSEQNPDPAVIVRQCCETLSTLQQVDTKNKFAVIIHDVVNAPFILSSIVQASESKLHVACLVAYGFIPSEMTPLPVMLHLHSDLKSKSSGPNAVSHLYQAESPHFTLPQTAHYKSGAAAVAHSRTLTFLRSHLGGPIFDLEAIWEEHTRFEFEVRSVARTMGTMVAEPYVNHIPTMVGGVGRQELTEFYRDHFIFSNPDDAKLQIVSRTVGGDRIIDEFVFHVTHDCVIDWLLPGVAPSGNKLSIPMLAVVNIRGDRLYHEHIWWDQSTALRQAGLLPLNMLYPTPQGTRMVRLPVAGAETAAKLTDETSVASNTMLASNRD